MKNLEKQLQEQMQKRPDIFVKQSAGKPFEAKCPACGYHELLLLFTNEGDAVCTHCNARVNIDFR